MKKIECIIMDWAGTAVDYGCFAPVAAFLKAFAENWLGADFNKIKIVFTSNFSTNAGIMALNGLGYPVSIEAAIQYWREDLLIQKRLYPEITANTVIAWRRNIPHSYAVHKFIEEINAFKA